MPVLGVYWGWESHPPPPSPCVQEDLTLPPPYPTPFKLAACSEPVRASGSLRPRAFIYTCGLAQYVRARMLASLRSIYLRPRSRWVRCPR